MSRSGLIFASMTLRGWRKLAVLVAAGIIICSTISLVFHHVLFLGETTSVRSKATFSAVALPFILAGPLFFYISLKLRQLSYLNRQLQHLADHDHLTSLLNRGAFLKAFEHSPSESSRGVGALLLIDVDHFKGVNDRWGHAAGDQVLQSIAKGIRSELRATDIVGRFGGEEFGVCLHETNEQDALTVARRVRAAVEALRIQLPDGSDIRVTISIGLVAWRGVEKFERLYHHADLKLYEAKAKGRNRIEVLEGPLGDNPSLPA